MEPGLNLIRMIPVQFGPYVLLERLVTTSMVDVHLARATGPTFPELFAIRRLHQIFADLPEFKAMFIHEAALVRRMNHPNLETVIETGDIDGTPYIATEYMHGRSLQRLLEVREARPLPPQVAAYIALEVARALQSLHNLSDENGEALNIVKRDLSPNDIFVTSDGQIKMMGLGVAKSAAQVEITQPGVIKGKFSYMSPEQARLESVDQRSDLYSLGLVLREMLTGHRAFLGANDLETFQLNARAELPRLHADPDASQSGLDWILDNALTASPVLRYGDAGAMTRDLEEFLRDHREGDPRERLSELLHEALGAELTEEKRRAEIYRSRD